MIEASKDGVIAGAGLDVFAEEPMPAASPLWGMDNVFVSPHMSGDFHGHKARSWQRCSSRTSGATAPASRS